MVRPWQPFVATPPLPSTAQSLCLPRRVFIKDRRCRTGLRLEGPFNRSVYTLGQVRIFARTETRLGVGARTSLRA